MKKEEEVNGVKMNASDTVQTDGTPEAGEEQEPNQGGVPAEESDTETLRRLLTEQMARAEDYYGRLVRLQADFENFRRRTRQEMEGVYKYASEQIVGALLPVLDNFERAIAYGDSIEGFKSGVEMILRQLKEVLAAEGVKEITSVGEQFDPEKHEAVLQVESDEYEDNTVIEEMRRGYYLKDRVIRPALVKVAKSSKKQGVE
ncbi:MAG TPA: nucleotide exchange factor GrpE [Bacillota bacterium]|nr:nucleotide exchange factor GrpE [Bacillota bacterium]